VRASVRLTSLFSGWTSVIGFVRKMDLRSPSPQPSPPGRGRIACLAFVALLFASHSANAAFVYDTPAEFLTSGDFNGDGIADVLVLDKATGNARVGYQNIAGALTWSQPFLTGVESASALTVGRFAQTNADEIAITSAQLNRIHILTLSNSVSAPPPIVVNPPHPNTALLVALDAPYGITTGRSWLDAATHDPGITLLDLLAFSADGLSSFQDQIAADGFLSSASSFRRSASDATLLAAIKRGSNDTFVAYAYTNTAAPVLVRSNLASGTEYVFGRFNNEPNPRLLFYVPGQSNIIVQPLTNNGSGFVFGPATLNTLTSAVQRLYYVDEQTNGLVIVHFGNGIVGLRPPAGGGGQLNVSPGVGLGPSGNVVGVAPLGFGKFALLERNSNSIYSVTAKVFSLSGGNYTLTSSSTLPNVTTAATRGNVWIFQTEPFVNSAATVIGSLNAPVWSSTIFGLPGSLSVRVETDGGVSSGLGNPGTNNFGAPPAGAAYVLPNQYREDISFFGYAPPRAPEPSVITISPPPGSYEGPIQISFIKQNAAHDVNYRLSDADTWQLYSAPFLLTNDATVQFYGSPPSGARGQLQFATYALGNIPVEPEPLVPIPGSGNTNPPPGINTNFLIISANGTVFYSRHSLLAELDAGFQGPSSYFSFADSPFNAAGFNYFYLENFEDNAFNTPGANASPGWIVATTAGGADSVEPGGRSYYSNGQTDLTINFNAAALGGNLPTHAGIVWTDVGNVTSGSFGFGNVRFTARDANGIVITSYEAVSLGNGSPVASQPEDRFFGIVNAGGISSISITMPASGDWEVDHLQYGYLSAGGFNDSIWAINLDGSGETYITHGARPRVTRDGHWMAFLREGGTVTGQGNIWLKDLTTGQETRFFTNTDAIMAFDWNEAQNELVFDNNCALWRKPLNGPATQLPLALTPECFNGAPVVNPANGRLAFHNVNPGGPQGVYVTPPDWSSRTRLTEPGTLRLRWPAWSRDGSRLAMADRTSSAFINTGVNLWTAAADGSNLRQITALTEPAGGFPRGAIWKPDGCGLVGAGSIGGTNGLWIIPLATDGGACNCSLLRLPTSPGDLIDFVGSIVVAPQAVVGVPGLFIRTEPNAVVVYWNTSFEGFVLEYTTNLAPNSTWTQINGPYFLASPYYEYREAKTSLATKKFFRLRYPGIIFLTPTEPELSFRVQSGQAVLTWPADYVGYTLESTTNLAPAAIWTPVSASYGITNGQFEFRQNLIGAKPREFFRLRWP